MGFIKINRKTNGVVSIETESNTTYFSRNTLFRVTHNAQYDGADITAGGSHFLIKSSDELSISGASVHGNISQAIVNFFKNGNQF